MPNFGIVEFFDEHLAQKTCPQQRQWCWWRKHRNDWRKHQNRRDSKDGGIKKNLDQHKITRKKGNVFPKEPFDMTERILQKIQRKQMYSFRYDYLHNCMWLWFEKDINMSIKQFIKMSETDISKSKIFWPNPTKKDFKMNCHKLIELTAIGKLTAACPKI